MSYGRHADGWDNHVSTGPPMGHHSPQKVTLLALIKHHLRDWLTVGVLAVLELIVYFLIPPFRRFVNIVSMQDYKYPEKPETVPTWSIGIVALVIPVIVFLLYFIKRRSIRDFHSAFLGLATALVITALFTDSIKNLVGMPRPDFYHRCFPDGIAVYTNDLEQQAICHPISERPFRDAYKSFPSGHVSWAFAGLGFLSLYLAGKMSLFDKRGYSSRVFIVLFPLLAATLIGITRVNDYQHRWVDIIAAAVLGLGAAYFCHRQFYPSIYHGELAGYPYEYEPQGIFSHGLHGSRPVPTLNGPPNDVEAGRL